MAESVRRRLSPNLAAGLVLLLVVVLLLAWQRPWSSDDPDSDAYPLPDDPASVLADQARALTSATSESAFANAMGRGEQAHELATAVWRARDLLGVTDVTWRYRSGGDIVVYEDGDSRAGFDVGWGEGTVKVDLRVEPREDGSFDIVGIDGTTDAALPIWLAGSLTAHTSEGVEVIRIDGGDTSVDVEKMAAVARRDVASLLGSADTPLVIVSAPTEQIAAELLGSADTGLSTIAAVATSHDGRDGRLPERIVVLNPAVFASMDERAAQVVLTHEATHVLAGGVGSGADTWVIEGFADFVALHDDTADLSISAGQILRQVKRSGAPEALPTDEDFAHAAHGLGAVYESTWLAFRMLAEDHGDRAVIEFYRAVTGGDTTDKASRETFGEPIAAVTEQWRDYLTTLASQVD